MRTFKCRHCGLEVRCLGQVLGHRCPSNKSRWSGPWLLVTDPDDSQEDNPHG